MPDSPLSGKFELDLYGGYATEIAPGTAVDVGVNWYGSPVNRSWAGPADYFEFNGKIPHYFGPLHAHGTFAYSHAQRSMRARWCYILVSSSGIQGPPVLVHRRFC